MSNNVTAIPPAPAWEASAHFRKTFEFETDCWDVHDALQSGSPGFTLIDVRSPEAFSRGHVPGAVNIPHRKIVASRLAAFPTDTCFVAYCAGPHCNGAARAAIRLAEIGFSVKIMPGGVTGWLDEGFSLESTSHDA